MSPALKLGGFVLGLVTVFAAAAAAGAVVGPIVDGAAPTHGSELGGTAAHDEMSAMSVTEEDAAGGLAIAEDGYRLVLADSELGAGRAVAVRFAVLGPGGDPVTAYDESHTKRLHLIAVRRDMTGFQHVHPTLAPDGTWSVPLDLRHPGEWRVFADFVPSGDEPLTLGADLSVGGRYDPRPLPTAAAGTRVDGYTVRLDGRLVPGAESQLTLTVSEDGRPVTDLDPYLGAYGHLVALRDGDLAYLHVHPDGEPGDGTTEPGPDVSFHATAPSAGRYRLFLDFRHEGTVHTAELTAAATASTAGAGTNGHDETTRERHGHDH